MTEPAKQPRHRGHNIELGGTTYVVPPLNFRQLRDLAADIEALGAIDPNSLRLTAEDVGRILKIAHAALSRNYPDLTIEQMEELVDLGNAKELMMAVTGVSGLEYRETKLGEGRSHLTGAT
jgi:hypothetical protein